MNQLISEPTLVRPKMGGVRVGAGRPKAALLDRVRAAVWYCHVRDGSPWENDSQLDCNYLVAPGRKPIKTLDRLHAFERVRRWQRSPDVKLTNKDTLDTYNLLDRVESHCAGTRGVFHHPFWLVIKPELLSLDQIHDIRTELLRRFGLRRMELRAGWAKVRGLLPNAPEHPLRVNQRYVAGWVENPTLDSLALLCVFLREAEILGGLTGPNTTAPVEFKSALLAATENFVKHVRMRFMESLGEWFRTLVSQFVNTLERTTPIQKVLNMPHQPLIPIGEASDEDERLWTHLAPVYLWHSLEAALDKPDPTGTAEPRDKAAEERAFAERLAKAMQNYLSEKKKRQQRR